MIAGPLANIFGRLPKGIKNAALQALEIKALIINHFHESILLDGYLGITISCMIPCFVITTSLNEDMLQAANQLIKLQRYPGNPNDCSSVLPLCEPRAY